MLVELDQSTFIGWMMETSGRPLEVYHKGKVVGSQSPNHNLALFGR